MTSLVNKATENIIDTHGFEHLSASVGVIVIVLLIVLLIEREVLRAFGGPRALAHRGQPPAAARGHRDHRHPDPGPPARLADVGHGRRSTGTGSGRGGRGG